MQAYDFNPEQAMTETGLDNAVGEKMLAEVMKTDWKSPGERSDASSNSMFGKNWQADSGGKLVALDMMTGKLLTRDESGRKVDYEAHSDSERMSGKSSLALSSAFMMSPLMMLGLGATFAVVDQVEGNQQNKEVDRLKQEFKGKGQESESNKNQDATRNLKGISKEMILKSFLITNDKKFNPSDRLSNSIGLAMDGNLTQRRNLDFNKWIREAEKGDIKRKKKLENTAKLERKRQRLKVSMPIDRKMSVGKLIKRKEEIADRIEKGHENGTSLEEASRLHSQLEVLDRAIIRLSNLGM